VSANNFIDNIAMMRFVFLIVFSQIFAVESGSSSACSLRCNDF
jgi:hypothetical protein